MSGFDGLTLAILAAGLSTRFGADKLAQPLDGLPVGLHIAQAVAGLPFAKKVAVCAADGALADGYRRLGIAVLLNPAPGQGLSTSLAIAGRAATAANSRGLVICLADMPKIGAGVLTALIAGWEADPTGPVVTTGSAYRGPPAILPRALFPALATLAGDRGARDLLAGARAIAAADALLIDIDRPGDLQRAAT